MNEHSQGKGGQQFLFMHMKYVQQMTQLERNQNYFVEAMVARKIFFFFLTKYCITSSLYSVSQVSMKMFHSELI